MGGPASVRSAFCARADHERCPHWAGLRARLLPRNRKEVLICACACHAGCPVAGRRTASMEDWRRRCVCSGADRSKEVQDRHDEWRREMAAVLATVDLSGHPDAAEIERRLRAALAAHGEAIPPGLTGWSRLLAASTARAGTRIPRLLGLAVKGVSANVHWAWRTDGPDSHNRAEARKAYRAAGAYAAVAALLVAAAARSSGRRRLLSAAAAGVTCLVAGWIVIVDTACIQLARLAEDRGGERHRSG